jgi:hypothetical protein
MVSKKMMGDGVSFHKSPGKFRTIRINMTPKQSLVLRKGGAITVKMITPDGSHELSLPEVDVKKLMTKLQKGVGGRIKLNGGSILQDFGRYIQPLSDAAIDRGRRELGSGMKIKPAVIGRGRRGKGVFDGVNKFFTQTLPNSLVDVAVPGVIEAVGSAGGAYLGGPAGAMVGKYAGSRAGEAAARRIRKAQGRGLMTDIAKAVAKKVAKKAVSYAGKKAKQGANYLIDRVESGANEMIGDGIYPAGTGIYPAGVNLRKGSGMNPPVIQTGTPYISRSSPAFNPVQLPNPFVSNSTVMRQAKTGGKIIRM